MINICESIQCPFATKLTESCFGCRYYSVASHCHLLHSPYSNPHSWRLEDVGKQVISETQYFLYGFPENLNLEELRRQNEEWLSNCTTAKEQLELEKELY